MDDAEVVANYPKLLAKMRRLGLQVADMPDDVAQSMLVLHQHYQLSTMPYKLVLIVYDGRAVDGNTENATPLAIYENNETLPKVREDWKGHDAVIYSYRKFGDRLEQETFVEKVPQ